MLLVQGRLLKTQQELQMVNEQLQAEQVAAAQEIAASEEKHAALVEEQQIRYALLQVCMP